MDLATGVPSRLAPAAIGGSRASGSRLSHDSERHGAFDAGVPIEVVSSADIQAEADSSDAADVACPGPAGEVFGS
jgi:hypothetical protein